MTASRLSQRPTTTSARRAPERSLALFVLLALLGACAEEPAPVAPAPAEPAPAPAEVGAAPDVAAPVPAPGPAATVALLSGEQRSVAELRGRWLFVNYWAEWCAPCREEIPELNTLHEEGGEVFVLGVNFDQLEAEAMRPQVEELGIRFPVAAEDPTLALGLDLPEVLPSTFVFDPSGAPVAVLRGPQTLEALHAAMGR